MRHERDRDYPAECVCQIRPEPETSRRDRLIKGSPASENKLTTRIQSDKNVQRTIHADKMTDAGFARNPITPINPIESQSLRPVAKVLLSRAERRCCVSAQRASSSHSLAQRAREIATKPSSRPNGSAVHLQCTPNGRPVGPENIFSARGPGPPGQAIGTGGPLGRKRW